jgi:hypothetical protein
MAPPDRAFSAEAQSSPHYMLESDPLDLRKSAVQKPVPITGSIAAALSTDESDAQKLMFQDRQRASMTSQEQPPGGNAVRYRSNTAADKDNNAANAAKENVSETADTPFDAPPQRPRIVSTIGKKNRQ